MQMPEKVHLTSCKHKSHLLNFFLALPQKPAHYSFPVHSGQSSGRSSQSDGWNHKVVVWGPGDSFSFYSGSLQLAELSCPASVALVMQAKARCWGLPTGLWVCMCACVSKHAPPQQVPKAAPLQVHVPTQSCTWVSAGRCAKATTCAYPPAWLWNPPAKIPGKACGVL